jgi:8-oxo-dGTP pyrophosphatase MutT (NUDIX family)
MNKPRSCGFLIVTGDPIDSFLLMKHPDRWDLPKGHVDPGETDLQCALRELEEETGISESQLNVDPDFVFERHYPVQGERYGAPGELLEKSLLIFLGHVPERVHPTLTEHENYRWFDWMPPHQIQQQTIDPLLSALESYLK